jgi:hypothetical protein
MTKKSKSDKDREELDRRIGPGVLQRRANDAARREATKKSREKPKDDPKKPKPEGSR